jgi:hypothetical protein
VTLGNAPRGNYATNRCIYVRLIILLDAGNSLASDARFFILKRNSLENLTIIFYQRMIAHSLMEYVLSSHIEAIMKEYNNVSLMVGPTLDYYLTHIQRCEALTDTDIILARRRC